MSRPRATSRKLRRVQVLLALFLACGQAAQTARALLGAGAVPFPRSVPPGIWARNLLVARRAEADGTFEAEGNEDEKGPLEPRDSENKASEKDQDEVEGATTEAKPSFDQAEDKTVEEAASAQTADPKDEQLQKTVQEKEEVKEASFAVDTEDVEGATAKAEWLQKTVDQIREFAQKEVSCWVRAALEEDGDSEDALQIVRTLQKEKVRGRSLLGLTYERLVAAPYNIAAGPAQNLADRINAMLAPTAATGFQDLLAILDSTGHSASDLLAIKDQLQQQLSRSLHTEPNDSHYVNPNETSKAFLSEVSTMLQRFTSARPALLNKVDSPLLEYATMSGAGKTRWGFQVERLLKGDDEFRDCAVLRVGLNFNGGSGGGDADRTEAVHLISTHNFSKQQTMASLLFARGLLECSPDAVRHKVDWLRGLTTKEVLDALFARAHEADTRILVVHVDELAMLLSETRLGYTDSDLKRFVNSLADYNCGQKPLGLVVPVITHTSPVKWDPIPTDIPLKHMNLGAFSFNQSLQFFVGINVTDLDSRRAISACGGHAALLVEMRAFMKRRSGGLGALLTCSRLELHRKAVKATGMSKEDIMSLLRVILLQEVVSEDRILGYSQRGLILLERDDDRYCVSVPYPYLLNLLQLLDRPKRFEHLEWTGNTPAKNSWNTKAFEALCAIRIAIEMQGFPYDSPCDPQSVATTFKKDGQSRVCLAKKQNQAGVDAIGVHRDMMILLQCKYPEMDSTVQEWKEVEQFMNFIEKTGVNWTKSAGCNQIRAIFATGRAQRDYTSKRPTELEVDGVHISYTVYAKTENRKGCAIRTMPISTWIPASIMCF